MMIIESDEETTALDPAKVRCAELRVAKRRHAGTGVEHDGWALFIVYPMDSGERTIDMFYTDRDRALSVLRQVVAAYNEHWCRK